MCHFSYKTFIETCDFIVIGFELDNTIILLPPFMLGIVDTNLEHRV